MCRLPYSIRGSVENNHFYFKWGCSSRLATLSALTHTRTHTTNSQLYSTAKIPFLVRPNSAPKLAVQQFYVGKKKNYAEKLVIID